MPSTPTKTIVGVFDSYATAERVAQELVQSGFSRSDVRVTSNETFASDAARGNAGLTGTHTSHSAGGGISGFFRNLFGAGDDEDATYAEAINRGGAVVSVYADDDRIEMARDIIDRYDPVDIDSRRSRNVRSGHVDTGDQPIPVVEEELQVGKRAVQRGGVRVYSHIVEEPVEQEITLREERVRVDRRPVDRPATDADFRPPEQVIEVTETIEEPVIGKRARVREEIVVEKEQNTRTETIRDTVRRTDVNVEHLSGETRSADFDTDFRNDFSSRYGSVRGASYEAYAPAYQYGYTTASDARYRGRSWDEVHDDIRTSYMREYPESKWEQVKDAVRFGWEKVTRQRR